MANPFTRDPVATNADISFSGDEDTGVVSEASNHVGLMAGGKRFFQQGTDASSKVFVGSNIERVALVASDAAGGMLAWANPYGSSIIVTRVLVDLVTASAGVCTVDVGVAANATTLSDTAIDGLNINAAAGLFDNVENQGTNGKSALKMTSTQYLTASMASGAAAGAAGYFYIEWVPA